VAAVNATTQEEVRTKMTTMRAPSSAPADASAPPLPDVIRLTVPAKYDGEYWFTFNADKTAEEVPAVLRDRYPHLASVTLNESGDWVRVIERSSWDAPVERYRLYGLSRADIDNESSDDDLVHVRLVRLGCEVIEVIESTAERTNDFDWLAVMTQERKTNQ
jgi:hypothetical protein